MKKGKHISTFLRNKYREQFAGKLRQLNLIDDKKRIVECRNAILDSGGAFFLSQLLYDSIIRRLNTPELYYKTYLGTSSLEGVLLLGNLISQAGWNGKYWQSFIMRREYDKDDKIINKFDGFYGNDSPIIVLEGVVGNGEDLVEMVETLRENKITKIRSAHCIVDLEEGAKKNLADVGVKLCSIYTISSLLDYKLDVEQEELVGQERVQTVAYYN